MSRRNRHIVWILTAIAGWSQAACVAPDAPRTGPRLSDSGLRSTPTSGLATTTGTPPTDTLYDCSLPWPTPLGSQVVSAMPRSEDFDISPEGTLIHVEDGNLVERSYDGQLVAVISPNITAEAAGTRLLPTGDVLVAAVPEGTLYRVDRATGEKVAIWSGNRPNGLDVDAQNNVYLSDFNEQGSVVRVNAYQPQDQEVLLDDVYNPNGVALAPDGRSLYVALNHLDRILVLERSSTTDPWGPPRSFREQAGIPQGLAVDACGTVYWEAGSDVFRQRADGSESGPVVQLDWGYFPNMRFGTDAGGFERASLYRLADGDLHRVHVGIPGASIAAIQTTPVHAPEDHLTAPRTCP